MSETRLEQMGEELRRAAALFCDEAFKSGHWPNPDHGYSTCEICTLAGAAGHVNFDTDKKRDRERLA